MITRDQSALLSPVERDLRLDLFRGIGLWMIFLDHIPQDVVAWLTLRNYGFSDAAEFFVFISGYLVGWIYGPVVAGGWFLAALKRLWRRALELYVAHIMLFLLFTAQIARTVRRFDNPMYAHEFNVFNFLSHPDELIGQAILLKYKPVNLDVLPLYIALVVASPFVVWCLVRRPNLTLAASVLLYVLSRWFNWNIASYPPGTTWYFNPFCWQLMFVFAAWCGIGQIDTISKWVWSRTAMVLAAAWLVFAFLIVMTWHLHALEALIPKWMIKSIYPIDKTDLDMLRFTHFLALAIWVTYLISRKWRALHGVWLRPIILCGQHSLPIFCLGVFLSFSAHWILTQYSRGIWEQLAVSALGIVIMIGAAWLLDRAKRVPNLFVKVTEVEEDEAALDSAPATTTAAAPAAH
ncbi:OpgC domain-containing protein [Bradyrhizobium sp. CCBAU 53351]|uniref:OpgC domain-containing protein n=1 Tax=Bradyrhizobium sp. CCBAU 53351 TaxID=1325114 RepID=UPI001886D7F3|nr:OpgC domain-containing protein [Bradyrhizobium sp. CCBAU 53351]QOZ79638.1 OpgC domain-containing protein [Bradyrhizobium sp. CCBAU 53351]